MHAKIYQTSQMLVHVLSDRSGCDVVEKVCDAKNEDEMGSRSTRDLMFILLEAKLGYWILIFVFLLIHVLLIHTQTSTERVRFRDCSMEITISYTRSVLIVECINKNFFNFRVVLAIRMALLVLDLGLRGLYQMYVGLRVIN